MERQLASRTYLESTDFPFHIQWYELTPGRNVPEHSHEFIELVYVAQGRGCHDYNGHSYPIAAGDVFVISQGMDHAYRVDAQQSLKVCNVLFETPLLASELAVMAEVTPFVRFFYLEPFLRQSADFQAHLTVNSMEALEIERLLARIGTVYQEKGLGYRIWIKALLIELFVMLSRCCARTLEKPGLGKGAIDEDVIRSICEFIERHYEQNWTLEQIRSMCGMSKTKFSEQFKAVTGTNLIKYRNAVRIRQAERLLAATDWKVIAVSEQVGFDDLSLFNRTFKQQTGMTPREYRLLHHAAGNGGGQ